MDNAQTSSYSTVAAQNLPSGNQFWYDRQVEVHVKFKTPLKREEIYDELVKLHYDFKNKLSAMIQLPGLIATLYAYNRESAKQLRQLLALSPKVQEVYGVGENELKVTISRVPPQIKEEEIAQVIKDFAEPLRMNIIKDKYGIQTGSRHVIIKRSIMQHIPRFLK